MYVQSINQSILEWPK